MEQWLSKVSQALLPFASQTLGFLLRDQKDRVKPFICLPLAEQSFHFNVVNSELSTQHWQTQNTGHPQKQILRKRLLGKATLCLSSYVTHTNPWLHLHPLGLCAVVHMGNADMCVHLHLTEAKIPR